MSFRFLPAWPAVLVVLFVSLSGSTDGADLPKSKFAWTYQEARDALVRAPHDPYLQFVVLQRARALGSGDTQEAESLIQQLLGRQRFTGGREGDVDLLSLTSGSLAVQESLQLDTLLGDDASTTTLGNSVALSGLKGPGVESHPWKTMLAGRSPKVSGLSRSVPSDFAFIESRSLSKLTDILDSGDLWQRHVLVQGGLSATAVPVSQRIRTQLAVQVDPLLKPVYDSVVERVAIASSDLYFQEGNDVTLLFALKQPQLFRARMDGFLAEAAALPGATRSSEEERGVAIEFVGTPDRSVHVYSAYPRPDLHLRSNSRAALRRMIDLLETSEGENGSLGDSDEFRYIRTLMPLDADEEDLFVYLSDPFIRRILGPKVKLTERRRLIALNHLRLIGYAAALFQTQHGRRAESIDELIAAKCAPRDLRERCISPFGGTYQLAPDGLTAFCSLSGTANHPTPGYELPLDQVSEKEAEEYRQFVEDYDNYWRRYFDPIAVRVRMTPKQYRAETIVLPLIDNSVYQNLLTAVGGEPADLEALPVPPSNIGSFAVHLQKELLTGELSPAIDMGSHMLFSGGPPAPDVARFLRDGIGDSVSYNVCDNEPLFDLNLTRLGAMMVRFGGFERDGASIGLLIGSLAAPVYVAIPVKDAKVVDRFLGELDPHLAIAARQNWSDAILDFRGDFYLIPGESPDEAPTRALTLHLGPATWRFFWARSGNGLYIASRKSVLDEIRAMPAESTPKDSSPTRSHARLTIRPQHWQKILPTYRLGWAENARSATLQNLGRLSPFVRAYLSTHPDEADGDPARIVAGAVQLAEQVNGVTFLLADGGAYQLSADRRSIVHSQYGDGFLPRQTVAPAADGLLEQRLKEFGGLTADLTFLEDGLHAVVTIDRNPVP